MAELSEFLTAQDHVWQDVQRELGQGRKTSHWIWWVFPQLALLGRSPRAIHFGLQGIAEATAFQNHKILGMRLEDCADLLLSHANLPPGTILGTVDAQKVRSSMTLFEAVPNAPATYGRVLDRMYGGNRCPVTTGVLEGGG